MDSNAWALCQKYLSPLLNQGGLHRAKGQSLYVRLEHWDPLRNQSARAAFWKADNLGSHPETRERLGVTYVSECFRRDALTDSRFPEGQSLGHSQNGRRWPSMIHDSEEMSHWVGETGQIQTSLYIMESPAKPADLASYQAREGRHSRNMLSIFN